MLKAVTTTKQRTLAASATLSGKGLFTGAPVTVTLLPAEADHGIVFRRSDLPGAEPIPAIVEYVEPQPRRTTLARGKASVQTVEHCLSAMAGMGIDNALIELDGPELPGGDGSAMPFVNAIKGVGLVEQDEVRNAVAVTEPITVSDGDATVSVFPVSGTTLDLLYDLDHGHGPIERQTHAFALDHDAYADSIAPARTFSLLEEAKAMRAAGMFGHLSPSDMLVVGDRGPVDNAYRFNNEPARHKLLDLLGDLSLIGQPLVGRVVASRSGHALNHALAKRVAEALRGVAAPAPAMNIRQIMRLLPHRYPMVLVDRVLEIQGDQRAVGVKNVSINEPFFQGHYPGAPIMPGVLIVEAMSQLAGLMLSRKLELTGKVAVLLSLDKVKLRRAVGPGDQIVLEANAVRASPRGGEVQCRAAVAGAVVAEALVKFMMVDADTE